MAADDPHFRLRVPAELRDRIAASAKAAGRSMNAEVVHRLTTSFESVSEDLHLAYLARATAYALTSLDLAKKILEQPQAFGKDEMDYARKTAEQSDRDMRKYALDIIKLTEKYADHNQDRASTG